jgi:predicted deacetylase
MSTTQYLLRFDDICPTMNWSVWAEIETILVKRRLKPILAVVPDNRDPGLQVAPPAADFWDRVRGWQDRGWTIALHGFQHRYVSQNAGVAGSRKKSEFAGLPAEEQREKLRLGMQIFEREGITSRVWVAPGHTFDAATVALLPAFGLRVIHDGYFRSPYVCSAGMIWLPQQLHYFRAAPAGVWTVCCHHNHWNASQVSRFGEEVEEYGANLASLDDILARNGQRKCSWSAWLCTHPRLSKLLIRAELKLWSWWNSWREPQRRNPSAVQLPG